MEVGDLEASRPSRSSEKGRSRKRHHSIRSIGGMTDRRRPTEPRLVKRKGGPPLLLKGSHQSDHIQG
jgi:hypothetical protein